MINQNKCTAGVDEAGRGALAGPVVAAAVIMKAEFCIEGLTDSKKIHRRRRKQIARTIKKECRCWSIGIGSVEEIDRINILQSTLLAMKRAIQSLSIRPDEVVVDGNQTPSIDIPVSAIVKGDLIVPTISAASILAKVTRDQLMIEYANQYPQYGFDRHVGYGTLQHIQALQEFGVSPIHRLSYSPVAAIKNR